MFKNSKTFRLFISSTFSDFQKEREILQSKVFPKIKIYCQENGYTFQPIDLRWGISNEAQIDQKTLELCLDEVKDCKNYTHPNFLIMLGDRYGWIPLPTTIEKLEFELLLNTSLEQDKQLLTTWYYEDKNQIPTSYKLKERENEFIGFSTWEKVESRLRTILQVAVNKSDLSHENKDKYFTSATEAEALEGIIPYIKITDNQKKLLQEDPTLKEKDPQYIFSFFRNINKSTQKGDKFIIDDYDKAQQFKQKIKAVLPASSIFDVEVDQINLNELDSTYLDEFESQVTIFLKKQIDEQKRRENSESISKLDIELLQQELFALEKSKNFIGQKEVLKHINNYILSESQAPLIVYGSSGIGKSAILAKSIFSNNIHNKKIVYRFIGATTDSNTTQEVLSSILEELDISFSTLLQKENKSLDLMSSLQEVENSFIDFSKAIQQSIMNIKEDVVIFIDAVDQLANNDHFIWLPTELPKNVKIIISALDDENYKKDSQCFESLKNKTNNLYKIKPFENSLQLLQVLLQKNNRTIQEVQKEYFLTQSEKVHSPLYVTIAAHELMYWKSTDNKNLANTQKDIIQDYINNLSTLYHHNALFVHKVLGYICASKDGLSESELLELLSTDETFVQAMAPETWHTNITRELPIVIWARLHSQLKVFFNIKRQDNQELMYFFHREFEDVINNLPSQKKEHENIIEATQKLILKYQDEDFSDNRWGKLYSKLIVEYYIKYDSEKALNKYSIFITNLDNDKYKEGFYGVCATSGTKNQQKQDFQRSIVYFKINYICAKIMFNKNPFTETVKYNKELTEYAIEDFNHKNVELDPDVVHILNEITEKSIWTTAYIRSTMNLSQILRYIKQSDKAIILLEEVESIAKTLFNENPYIWADNYTKLLNTLSSLYSNTNQSKKSFTLLLKNSEVLEWLYHSENKILWEEEYLTNLNNLGVEYLKNNQIIEALDLLEKALIISKQLYNNDHNKWSQLYTSILNSLGQVYSKVNRAEEAMLLLTDALKIIKKYLSTNTLIWNEKFIICSNNLLGIYSKLNQIEKAVELGQEVLTKINIFYSKNKFVWDEQYISIVSQVGMAYLNSNRVEESIKLLEKNLDLVDEYYYSNIELNSKIYITYLINLSTAYSNNRQNLEALEILNKLLTISENLYNKNQELWVENYLFILSNLATIYKDINQFDNAISYAMKTIDVFENSYSKNAIKTYVISLYILSDIYNQIGEAKKALVFGLKALEEIEDLFIQNQKEWAFLYSQITNILGLIYFYTDIEKSIIYYKKSLKSIDILNSIFGQNINQSQVQIYYTLLNLYIRVERYDDIIILGEKIINILNEFISDDISKWPKEYLLVFVYLGSIYVKKKDYTNAYKNYNIYFNIIDFKILNLTSLDSFIYPFIGYYITMLHLNKNTKDLDNFAINHIELFKYKLGYKYKFEINRLKKLLEEQMKLKKSNESYDLFIKLFINENF